MLFFDVVSRIWADRTLLDAPVQANNVVESLVCRVRKKYCYIKSFLKAMGMAAGAVGREFDL